MPEILYPEWRNGNKEIRYPFNDRTTLVNSDGQKVDQDLFDDARLYPIGGGVGMFLSKVNVTGTLITFTISDPANGELCSGTYDANAAPAEVLLTDIYGRPAGVLVSDTQRLSALIAIYGPGDTVFEAEQTEFAPTVAIPTPQIGLRGVLLDDGNIVSGDIYLAGANGIVLSVEDGSIRVDALGNPYALDAACTEEGVPLPPFCGLKTINGIEPDDRGDFKLSIGGNLATDPVIRLEIDDTGQVQMKQVGTGKTGL